MKIAGYIVHDSIPVSRDPSSNGRYLARPGGKKKKKKKRIDTTRPDPMHYPDATPCTSSGHETSKHLIKPRKQAGRSSMKKKQNKKRCYRPKVAARDEIMGNPATVSGI